MKLHTFSTEKLSIEVNASRVQHSICKSRWNLNENTDRSVGGFAPETIYSVHVERHKQSIMKIEIKKVLVTTKQQELKIWKSRINSVEIHGISNCLLHALLTVQMEDHDRCQDAAAKVTHASIWSHFYVYLICYFMFQINKEQINYHWIS